MLDFGTGIFDAFSVLGAAGLIVALFLIFYLDAVFFPTLPELFAIIIFGTMPSWQWGGLNLLVICAAEILGVSTLYFTVKRADPPRWISDKVNRYRKCLLVSDERIILVNRIAPVVPFLGAFIAMANWDYRRSMLFLFIGGFAKYSLLLAMAGFFFKFFASGTAETVTLILVVIIIAVSMLLSYIRKKKIGEKCITGEPEVKS